MLHSSVSGTFEIVTDLVNQLYGASDKGTSVPKRVDFYRKILSYSPFANGE